MSKILVIGAMI